MHVLASLKMWLPQAGSGRGEAEVLTVSFGMSQKICGPFRVPLDSMMPAQIIIHHHTIGDAFPAYLDIFSMPRKHADDVKKQHLQESLK